MDKILWMLLILCSSFARMAHGMTSNSQEVRLLADLMAKFNSSIPLRMARPVSDASKPVQVDVRITLNQILDLYAREKKLVTSIWKRLIWTDPRLSWEPINYGGLEIIRFPMDIIWKPDVILLNALSTMVTSEEDINRLDVSSSGRVMFTRPFIYESPCDVNLYNFPYDVQNCSLRFGSWMYTKEELDMRFADENETLDMSSFIDNNEWFLSSHKEQQDIVKTLAGTYEDLVFSFKLCRNSGFYAKFMLIPTVLLTVIVLLIFWIPPSRPDRTGLGMSALGGLMLLLLMVVQISPPSTDIKIGTFYCMNIILVGLATVLSATVVALSRRSDRMSHKVRKIFIVHLGKLFCERTAVSVLQTNPRISTVVHQLTSGPSNGEANNAISNANNPLNTKKPKLKRSEGGERDKLSNAKDWQTMAIVLDRIYFIVFVVVVIFFLVFYFPWPEDCT